MVAGKAKDRQKRSKKTKFSFQWLPPLKKKNTDVDYTATLQPAILKHAKAAFLQVLHHVRCKTFTHPDASKNHVGVCQSFLAREL